MMNIYKISAPTGFPVEVLSKDEAVKQWKDSRLGIVKGGSEKLYESSLIALGGGAGILPVLFFLPAPAVQS